MVGISVACGVVAIVVAIIGGPTFGIIGGLIALVLGVVAMVTGIMAKKATNGAKGTPGFVCGIIGVVFGLIFTVGCFACGCSDPTGYTKFGCICGANMLANDVQNGVTQGLNELQSMLSEYNY